MYIKGHVPICVDAHCLMLEVLRYIALNALNTVQKDQSNVEDVKDRSNTPKGCNAMYVGDVEDGKRIYTHILAHNFLNT